MISNKRPPEVALIVAMGIKLIPPEFTTFKYNHSARAYSIRDEVKLKSICFKEYIPKDGGSHPTTSSVVDLLCRRSEFLKAKFSKEQARKNEIKGEVKKKVSNMWDTYIYAPVSSSRATSMIYIYKSKQDNATEGMHPDVPDCVNKEEVRFLETDNVWERQQELLRQIYGIEGLKSNLMSQYGVYRETSEEKKPMSFNKWVSESLNSYLLEDASQEEVTTIGWKCGEDRAIQYFSPTALNFYQQPDVLELGSAWDDIIERLSNPDEFLAWLWVLFAGKKASSQALWLYGSGNDGKSTIAETLHRIMKSVSCIIPSTQNQFTHAKLYMKRLAVNNDVRADSTIDDKFIFEVTGGDDADIERKGQNSFRGKINCMVLCTSNCLPRIDVYMTAHIRRLIVTKISPIKGVDRSSFSDEDFKERLYHERYYLMARAKEAHDKLLVEHNERMGTESDTLVNITLCEESKALIRNNCKTRYTLMAERFVESGRVYIGGNGEVSLTDLQKKFHAFMETQGVVTKGSAIGIGSDNLKNYLRFLGCKDLGASVKGLSFDGSTSSDVVDNIEDMF